MLLLFYLHYVVVPFYFTIRNYQVNMRYQRTCTSYSGPILFGFLTENILWQLPMCFLVRSFIFSLIYWGSWFNAVRIIFSPIKNHVWVAVSRYYIFRPACVASWNNTCYIPLGSYYLCHSFFIGCCDLFHHRNPSGFILFIGCIEVRYDFTWCI